MSAIILIVDLSLQNKIFIFKMPRIQTTRTGVKKYNFKKKRYNTSASMAAWRASKNPISQQAMRTGGWAEPTARGELKFIDHSSGTQTVASLNNTWSAGVLLNGLTPGSGAENRIGRKIIMKSLLLRYSIQVISHSQGSSRFRILVVYDKQANATAPGINDILAYNAFLSPNNLSNRDRFVTLADEYTDICGTFGECDDPDGMLKFKKLNLETIFNAGTAGTVADITSGSIYIFFCQSGSLAFTSATLNFQSRIRFIDP